MSIKRLALLAVLLGLSFGASAAEGDKPKVEKKEVRHEVVKESRDAGQVREVREVREVRHEHVRGSDCDRCGRGFFRPFTSFWTNTVGGNINCGIKRGTNAIGNAFD
jgi:hypothetical protein